MNRKPAVFRMFLLGVSVAVFVSTFGIPQGGSFQDYIITLIISYPVSTFILLLVYTIYSIYIRDSQNSFTILFFVSLIAYNAYFVFRFPGMMGTDAQGLGASAILNIITASFLFLASVVTVGTPDELDFRRYFNTLSYIVAGIIAGLIGLELLPAQSPQPPLRTDPPQVAAETQIAQLEATATANVELITRAAEITRTSEAQATLVAGTAQAQITAEFNDGQQTALAQNLTATQATVMTATADRYMTELAATRQIEQTRQAELQTTIDFLSTRASNTDTLNQLATSQAVIDATGTQLAASPPVIIVPTASPTLDTVETEIAMLNQTLQPPGIIDSPPNADAGETTTSLLENNGFQFVVGTMFAVASLLVSIIALFVKGKD